MAITKRIESYITFFFAGSFTADTSKRLVLSLDPAAIEWPESAYAARFSQRDTIDHEGVVFVGKEKDVSKLLYRAGSRVDSLQEIKDREDPHDGILISNMEINGWPAMIYTHFGNWPQPFDAEKMEILK
jgi:hypothetical protein